MRYLSGGREQECRARVLVNAAGPWAALPSRASITPRVSVPALELVQGTHLLLDGPPQQGVYYLESSACDGPRNIRHAVAGATAVGHDGRYAFTATSASVVPGPHEIHYLLGVLRHYFPAFRDAARSQVHGAFAGLRVLPAQGGHAFHRSRETLLVTDRDSRPRVLSIYGGKLTTWRAVSARVLSHIAPSLPQRRAVARTDRLELHPS